MMDDDPDHKHDMNAHHQRKPSYDTRFHEHMDSESPIMAVNHKQKPSKGGWNSAIFIIFVEVAERFSFFGMAANLVTYLTKVLNMPMAIAAKNVNMWMGASALFPLLGGFIADSYLGRFKTIVVASILYLIGTTLLTLSVFAVPLDYRIPVFFIAIYLTSLAQGGHRPCVQTFAADQFDEDIKREKEAKSSFFNWWYLGIMFGITLALVVVVYVQENIGWGIGFGILAVAVAVGLVIFLIGIPKYRIESLVGSPLSRVGQVIVAAARKWRVGQTGADRRVCFDDGAHSIGARTLAHTNQFRFLDKATIIDDIDDSKQIRNHWRLCSVNQVEEVKLILGLFPIWFSCMIFALVTSQQHTFYTKQGSTMITSIGSSFKIPPAWLNLFSCITIIIALLIYDRVLVPIARSFTKLPSGITFLQRIGIGIFCATIGIVVSALVEGKRVGIAKENGLLNTPHTTVPMSILWLIPQYMFNGVADAFTIVGMQEIFYEQVPEKMRSMGAATFISSMGIGSFMSGAAITMAQAISSRFGNKWLGDNLNQAHLDYFYWVLAGLSGLNMCLYIWFAKGFVYKKVEECDPSNLAKTVEA